MIEALNGYVDDKGCLEVSVTLTGGITRDFIVREDDFYEGELTFMTVPKGMYTRAHYPRKKNDV